MASLHRKISKIHPHALIDKKSFDQMHPIGTQAVAAQDAAKAAEKVLEEAEAEPVIPIADEEELARIRRRRARRSGGRSSTILTDDETFGGA